MPKRERERETERERERERERETSSTDLEQCKKKCLLLGDVGRQPAKWLIELENKLEAALARSGKLIVFEQTQEKEKIKKKKGKRRDKRQRRNEVFTDMRKD